MAPPRAHPTGEVSETGKVDSTDLSIPVRAAEESHASVEGAFAPLRLPLFRDRWIAATVSGVGTWMQDTAGTWLMTVLTTSPLLIALMQTAASLPVLFLGLFAGATADIYDRRRLLIFWQCWMLGAVAVLAILTFAGAVSPVALLAFTFLLNIGSAMNNPAWQAIVPELVPDEQLPNAVTLNAASNNLARAVGPALGGLLVAAFTRADTGAGWVFLLNSASFAGVIWILWRWKRNPVFKSALPAERSSTRTALLWAAAGMAASLPFLLRIHILKGTLPDLTPYQPKRPVPAYATTSPEDGPVRLSVEYRVAPENLAAFTRAIYELGGARRRDGAIRWGIYRDAADPTRLNETFVMESWLDYLRSRERTIAADQAVRERVWALHIGPEPPRVTHQVWLSEAEVGQSPQTMAAANGSL